MELDPSKHEELHHMPGRHLVPHPGLWTSVRATKRTTYNNELQYAQVNVELLTAI
jgi:hypothetical protein